MLKRPTSCYRVCRPKSKKQEDEFQKHCGYKTGLKNSKWKRNLTLFLLTLQQCIYIYYLYLYLRLCLYYLCLSLYRHRYGHLELLSFLGE